MTVHRYADVDWSRIVTRNAIPVTDPLRTLVDLAAVVAAESLTSAIEQPLATRLVTMEGLRAEASRLARRGRAGPGALRAVLDAATHARLSTT